MSEVTEGETADLRRPGGVDPDQVVRLLRRVGQRVALLVTLLDHRGQPAGSYAVGGLVAEVALAPYDSNGVDVAEDGLRVAVDRVVSL